MSDTTKTKQNRFKSWTMWAAVAGAAWLIMSALGVPEKIGLTNTFKTIVDAVGTILTLLGIVNNPTESSKL